MTSHYDIVLLTQKEYVNPPVLTSYTNNILMEDMLLTEALENKGLKVARTFWDDPHFDWQNTKHAIFRATWDYFYRFDEFHSWLNHIQTKINLINSYPIIKWNMDKHYLQDMAEQGITIPPTTYLKKGHMQTLEHVFSEHPWPKAILKPAIAGAARHTYLLDQSNIWDHQAIFQELISNEAMLLQEYQEQITHFGEVSFMVFGGSYSHAVLKKAKAGDFRVQDDFGGTVHPYQASDEEIHFVEQVIAQCQEKPVYARVDVMRDNQNQLCLSELELIEPELWLRTDQNSAKAMADAVLDYINRPHQSHDR